MTQDTVRMKNKTAEQLPAEAVWLANMKKLTFEPPLSRGQED